MNNIEKTQDNSLVLASTGYVFEKRKLRGIEPERKNSFEKDVFQKPSNEKKGTESELYKEEVDKSSNQEIIYENSTIIKKIEDPMEIKQEFDKNELKMNDISEKNLSEKENNKEEVIESPTNKGN